MKNRDRSGDEPGPPQMRAELEPARLLAQLVADGLVAPARLAPDTPPPLAPAGVMTLAALLADINQAREDR